MSESGTDFLCNKTFAQANSTGFHSIHPQVGIDSGPSNGTYAVTVYENSTGVAMDLWYNTGGADYSDPQALGYEVCWIAMPLLSEYATELAGTSDNLDCSTALTETCASDMKAYALNATKNVYADLDPEMEVPASLPDICYEVGKAVIQNVPASCGPYFDNNGGISAFPLTYATPKTEYLYTGTPACVLSDNTTNYKNLSGTSDVYWAIGGSFYNPTEAKYTLDEHFVVPIMTLFTPYLSNNNLSDHSIIAPQTYLSCMRSTQVNPGSQKVAALAVHSPSPSGSAAASTSAASSSSSNSLSGGDIAGIVIGVLAFVALILIAILLFIRRKKQQRKRRFAEENAHREEIAEIDGETGKVEADSYLSGIPEAVEKRKSTIDGGELPGVSKDMHHELDENAEENREIELASKEFHELPAADVQRPAQHEGVGYNNTD